YRRAQNDAIAGRIRDALVSHYGRDAVFMDVDNIPFGIDFREHIDQAMSPGDMVVAVIGPKWIGPVRGKKPRIDDETDPVRVEIETALRRGITVVPVLIDGASMPKPDELPGSIRSLSFRNAAPVDAGRDFHQHMDRLIRSMNSLQPTRPRTQVPRWGPLLVTTIAAVAVSALAWVFLPHFWTAPNASPPVSTEVAGVEVVPAHAVESVPTDPALPSVAASGSPIALVIANSDYRFLPKLKEPRFNGQLVADALREAGFQVTQLNDVTLAEVADALKQFAATARRSDRALFYFAGHGMVDRGLNYIAPVDAALPTSRDDVTFDAIGVDLVRSALEGASELRVLILDASFPNPTDHFGGRGFSAGLAEITAESREVVIFSAKPGEQVMDSAEGAGTFAKALAGQVATPGLEAFFLFRRVRDEVIGESNGKQTPFLSAALPDYPVYFSAK
ncbi:MAG TPA: caspase family protein, partial [Bauldia sp.]|nr:caspase family protein [Bauldia sp.]